MTPGDGRGEAALWQAVLLQIIADATSDPAPSRRDEVRARDDALSWLHGPATAWKHMVVSMAGLEPEAFFNRARAGLLEAPQGAHRRGRKLSEGESAARGNVQDPTRPNPDLISG